jgi:penicillin-binding protein-related factor A (putative recombinase)
MSIANLISQKSLKVQRGRDKDSVPNAKLGRDFENQIQAVCDIYQELRVAYIQRFEVPKQFIPANPKTGKPSFMCYKKKTGFDFIGGIIQKDFRIENMLSTKLNACFIEAKSNREGSIPVWQESTGIKKHQLDRLIWLENMGFFCLILWEVRSAGAVYKISPNNLAELVPYDEGSKSTKLTVDDCEENKIPRIVKMKYRGQDYYDFLGELEQ